MKIIAARIVGDTARTHTPSFWLVTKPPALYVTTEDGTENFLFAYYPDELTFTADEFVGLTVKEALALRHQRDVDYLQS